MEESKIIDGPDPLFPAELPPPRPGYEPKVSIVLLILVGMFIAGSMLGPVIYLMIAAICGWPIDSEHLVIGADAAAPDRWHMRLNLGLSHLTSFCLAGFATIWLCYRGITRNRRAWLDYLPVRNAPGWKMAIWAMLLMLVATPVVLYLNTLNQAIPLPDLFHDMEKQAEEMLKGLIKMDNVAELIANMVIIALLPAIGEELVFRAVLQKQLMRVIRNPYTAIVITAAIFSFAHLQLEGFLPRFLLGALLGWLFWRTNNFWVSAIAHFFNNGIQVLGYYLYSIHVSPFDMDQDIQVPVLMAIGSVLLIVGVVMMIERDVRLKADLRVG